LAEVCKANDERTFARMRGNDVDAPVPAVRRTASEPWGGLLTVIRRQ
jgi:hypothetical protein